MIVDMWHNETVTAIVSQEEAAPLRKKIQRCWPNLCSRFREASECSRRYFVGVSSRPHFSPTRLQQRRQPLGLCLVFSALSKIKWCFSAKTERFHWLGTTVLHAVKVVTSLRHSVSLSSEGYPACARQRKAAQRVAVSPSKIVGICGVFLRNRTLSVSTRTAR